MEMLQAMLDDCVRTATPRSDALHAMLVRPEQGTIERIDEAVAVGADNRHVTGSCHQRFLQIVAIGEFADGLAKAGGIADGATGAAGRQVADDLNGQLAVDADEGGIGAAGRSATER